MNHRDSGARKEWAAQQAAFEIKIVARRTASCRNLVSAIDDYAEYTDKTPAAASLAPEPEAPAYAASPRPMHRRTAMLREGMHNGNRPRSISEVGRSASVDHWCASPRLASPRLAAPRLGFENVVARDPSF